MRLRWVSAEGTGGQFLRYAGQERTNSRARKMDALTSALDNPLAKPLATLLGRYQPLGPEDMAQIARAALHAISHSAHSEITIETSWAGQRSLVLAAGWVAGSVIVSDGRRQVVSLHIAGDLLEPEAEGPPLIFTALTASHTFVATALLGSAGAPRATDAPRLVRALNGVRSSAVSRRLRHMVRLGALTAYERLADLILELRDRQAQAGLLTPGESMPLPLTQEILADHLGISMVHTNRMLQQMRQAGLIRQIGRTLLVPDAARLEAARPL